VKVNDGDAFIMQPGDFVLAVTMERVKIPTDLLGRLEGRSSLGRLGIVVHSTASIFDAGWDGQCVLELGNLGRMPVALYPGMRICAMAFEQLSSPAEVPYVNRKDAKYKFQSGPQESRYNQDKPTK
jgi:dCTP deaminase